MAPCKRIPGLHLALLTALGTWACGGEAGESPIAPDGSAHGDTPLSARAEIGEDAPHITAPPLMTSLGSVPIGEDGRSDLFTVALPLDHGVLGVLVEPTDPTERPDLCFQLEEVTTAAGATWVPKASGPAEWGRTCGECTQRVFLSYGAGLYVFPNGAESLAGGEQISARVALRDCLSQLPVSEAVDGPLPEAVSVSWASWPEPDEAEQLALRIHLVVGADTAPDALREGAVTRATELLAMAGVSLWVADETRVPDPGELAVSVGDLTALVDLLEQGLVSPGDVPVVLTPCVTLSNEVFGEMAQPDGFTPRIPGGYGGARAADAVFLRVTSCTDPAKGYWSSAEAMGTVMAHEIGHFLGLYHPPDHLPDTSGGGTLMDEDPLAHTPPDLTPSQRRVLRRHPLLRPVGQGSSEAGM